MDVIWKEVSDKVALSGFASGDYNYLLVLAGNAPFTDPEDAEKAVTWSGIGQVGAAASLIRLNDPDWTATDRINWNVRVSLHEIGHNLGLYHASNVWDTSDVGFLGSFTGSEYGDRYDRMGTGGGDFNARYKQWLNWLDEENLPLGTTAGTYVIREHDQDEKSGARGLQVRTGGGFSFLNEYHLFVEYRLRGPVPDLTTPYVPWTDTLRAYGAQIRVGSPYSPKSWLLDATPETPNDEPVDPVTELADIAGNVDCPLLPGRTFAFTRDGKTVYLTNLQADPNIGLLEVEVQHGPVPGNDPPSGSIGVSTPQGAVGQNIVFTANATDPDDGSFAYHWEIPQFDVSNVRPAVFPNAQSITVKFPTIGTWVARCTVSDKHGGTVTLTRSFSVVANSPPTISAISDKSLDEDTSILNLPFTVGDATTPAGSLTVSVSSSNGYLFPFNALTHGGSGANRTLSIVPPTNRNGTSTVTVSVYDGELVTVEQFLVTVRAVTPGSTLLASGSDGWRYWAQATAPAADWHTTAYNDTAWGLDSSRFVYPSVPFQLAGWTTLPSAPGRTTCYFRRAFTMPPLPNGAPMLRLLCDDGAIVYVNGVEVYRQNLPAGPVTPAMLALTSVEGASESAWTTVPLSGSSFFNGASNLIAVEVHDAGGPRGGGDVCFDLDFGLRLAPIVTSIGRQTSVEDQVAGPYNFTANDVESPAGQVWVTASSSNQALVLDTGIKTTWDVITGQRTIRCTPQPNAHGSTVITYKASDGFAETWRSFTLTVTPVNDPPEIVPLPDMAVALGEIPPLLGVTVGDADADPGSLAVTASANGVLGFSTLEVLPGPSPSTRWLRLVPQSGMAAQANVTLSVTDGNTTTTDTFIFRVSLPFSSTTTDINFIKSGDAVWRYWAKPLPLDGQGNPVDFTAPDFDHSFWISASTQSGYGDGGDPTAIPIYPLRITTYFRAKFTVPDPTQITQLKLRLLRDDGAVVYLNGTPVWSSNLPPVVTSTTPALSDISGADEDAWHALTLDTSALVAGSNTIAVEVHQSEMPITEVPGDLSFDFEIAGVALPAKSPDSIISQGESWAYWDGDVSNSGDGPNAWAAANYSDLTWKRGFARLGFGIGGEDTVVNAQQSTGFASPSVLFRKTFDIADPTAYRALHLYLQRDDGAVVFLNGVRVLEDGVNSGIEKDDYTFNHVTGANQTRWYHYLLDPARLIPGRNLIAVSVHQFVNIQTDLNFDLQLLGDLKDQPKLFLRPVGGNMELSWSGGYQGWNLLTSTDLATWAPVNAPQLLDAGWFYVTHPAPGPRRFYRLEKP